MDQKKNGYLTPLRYCQICSSLTDRRYTAPGGAMACQRRLAITKQKQKKEAMRFTTSHGSGAK